MPRELSRDGVRRVVTDEGAQLVDVLPPQEFEDEHLAGAISIPLRELGPGAIGALDRRRPVVAYCHDTL